MNKTEIRRLDKNDLSTFKNLIKAFNEVFGMQVQKNAKDDTLKELLGKSGFIAIAAIADGDVIGGLTAYELPSYYGDYKEVYLYDIAVKDKYQRQRTGKALINALKTQSSSNNVKTIFVEAHEKDVEAINFYRSTRATEERVVHFEYHAGSEL